MILSKTRTEVIREAAERLGIVGTGQVLEAEYADRLSINLDPLLMQLTIDEICPAVDDQAIPAEWFDALSGLLANQSASLGGRQYDPQIKAFYESMLRRLNSSGPSYNVQEVEYF